MRIFDALNARDADELAELLARPRRRPIRTLLARLLHGGAR
jgi:hypothetical protein